MFGQLCRRRGGGDHAGRPGCPVARLPSLGDTYCNTYHEENPRPRAPSDHPPQAVHAQELVTAVMHVHLAQAGQRLGFLGHRACRGRILELPPCERAGVRGVAHQCLGKSRSVDAQLRLRSMGAVNVMLHPRGAALTGETLWAAHEPPTADQRR
jgi:hypothetical protein